MGRGRKKPPGRPSAYDRCLLALALRDLSTATAALAEIDRDAIRAIAEEQLSVVREIEGCLERADRSGAGLLLGRLHGPPRATYHALVRTAPSRLAGDARANARRVARSAATNRNTAEGAPIPAAAELTPRTSREGRTGPLVDASLSPEELSNASDAVRVKLMSDRLDERLALSADTERHLSAIAAKAWRRRTKRCGATQLRVSRTELGIMAICLQAYLGGNRTRIPATALAAALGVGQAHVNSSVVALQKYLLRGSGWRMVGDKESGVYLVHESET